MPNKNRGKPGYTGPGMGEMNRLPKPPKYPLYDMPSLGMGKYKFVIKCHEYYQ